MTRIAIVGAGAVGLSCAMALTKKGETDVVLIDRSHLAAGSSSLSAGIYTRQYLDAPDIAIRADSYEVLRELERRGLVLHRVGFAWLAHDGATLESYARGVELQQSMGIDDAVLLDRAGVEKEFPSIRGDDLAGAGLIRSDGYLDGQQLCMLYAEVAAENGVEMCLNDKLLGAESLPSGGMKLTTRKRTIECDVVVNAGGMWAAEIGELLGAPVALAPSRHEACVFELDQEDVRLPCTMDAAPALAVDSLYFRPEGPLQIVAGLTSDPHDERELEGGGVPEVEEDYVYRVSAKLADRLPQLAGMGFVTKWFGYYPMSPSGRPTIAAAAENPAVFNMVGFGGSGILLSAAAGRFGADLLVDGKSPRAEDWSKLTL